jgi:hypothetical protein
VKGRTQHVDFLAVNKDVQISVEVPVHLIGRGRARRRQRGRQPDPLHGADAGEAARRAELLRAVPRGLEIGDVKRVEDLSGLLPEGAEFDIEPDRTVVTINAPMSEEALEALEEAAGIETEEPELGSARSPRRSLPTTRPTTRADLRLAPSMARMLAAVRARREDVVADDRWLVVGLGNPGERVRAHPSQRRCRRRPRPRGRPARDVLAQQADTCEIAEVAVEGERLVLAVPESYMNRSGEPTQAAAAWYKVPVERVIVCHDDLDVSSRADSG